MRKKKNKISSLSPALGHINMNIKIENKPLYCSAWVSKISCRVMCNRIPCCGFSVHGRTDKASPGFKDTDKVGLHPLVGGKFQFSDGTFHNPNFVLQHVLVTETEHVQDGKKYKLSNQGLKAGDPVFPISQGFVGDDEKYHHQKFDFRNFMTGFPDEPHIILNLNHSDSKPFQVRTSHGYSPIECYFKIIEVEELK